MAAYPSPIRVPSKTNKPEAFHVYTMRQAIEEGFILDVLKNYTNYKVTYNLAMRINATDQEVQVIIEHFRDNVMGLLGGQAKANTSCYRDDSVKKTVFSPTGS